MKMLERTNHLEVKGILSDYFCTAFTPAFPFQLILTIQLTICGVVSKEQAMLEYSENFTNIETKTVQFILKVSLGVKHSFVKFINA